MVTAVLLVAAALIRIFAIPKFKYVPGKLQLLLEQAVGMFDGLAKSNSPWRNGFLGSYVFAAGAYIFFGTLFELFGLQAITTTGRSITLPAPLSRRQRRHYAGGAVLRVIFSGAIAGNGVRGIGKALKEVSLLISMSFRLFGALLSGLLVTELVYYYISPELRAAGDCGRAVHPAPRPDPELRAHHAGGAVLRGDERAPGAEAREKT